MLKISIVKVDDGYIVSGLKWGWVRPDGTWFVPLQFRKSLWYAVTAEIQWVRDRGGEAMLEVDGRTVM